MNEERIQAYLNLIQQLLTCPSGEENQILNQHRESLDTGFVIFLDVVAQRMQNLEKANFLRDIAHFVSENFIDSPYTAPPDADASLQFLMQVLKTTDNSKGNAPQVYPLLKANQDKLTFSLAEVLRQWASRTLPTVDKIQAYAIAVDITNFSNIIRQFPLGKRWSNLEIAIVGYEVILSVFTRTVYPQEWATAKHCLGTVYVYRIQGERAKNLEKAIAYYQEALEVLTPATYPQDWAAVQIGLGNTYYKRILEERGENLEQAIAAFKAALEVYTPEAFPENWAMAQIGLGNTYLDRIREERAENVEKAIKFYEAALTVRTRTAFPENWAGIQMNLGTAYRNRILGEPAENVEKAIKFYEAALTVRKLETFPEGWAEAQDNLATAYVDRILGDRAENIEKTITCYKAALQVYTRNAFPEDWARTQMGLGSAYSIRIRGDWGLNRKTAIACLKEALQVYTREAFPQNHLQTLFNLGPVYRLTSELQNAYDTFAAAIETIEEIRSGIIEGGETDKQKLAEKWNGLGLYRNMVEVCLELNKYAAALEYAERSKARNLVELLAATRLKPKDVSSEIWERYDDLYQKWWNLQQRRDSSDFSFGESFNNDDTRSIEISSPKRETVAAEISRTLTELRQQIDSLIETEITPHDPKFRFGQKVDPIGYEKIQKLVDEQTAIVEWYFTSKGIHAFIVTHQGEHPIVVSTDSSALAALEQLTNEYLNDYFPEDKTHWRQELPSYLQRLAEILELNHLISQIPSQYQQLILIPYRFLHLFPLHALPLSQTEYLSDRFPQGIRYAPSSQILQLSLSENTTPNQEEASFSPPYQGGAGGGSLFAIQNPTADLAYTDIEVEAIQTAFNPATVLKGEAASKTLFNQNVTDLKETTFAHFSCHGYFNFANPRISGLILADAKLSQTAATEKGIPVIRSRRGEFNPDECLTLPEIFNLRLRNCRLVALSACETGITDISTTSDEYISILAGFFFAGSRNVLGTLWAVNDVSTAIFMIRFYEILLGKSQPPAALALKQTQEWMRSRTVAELLEWIKGCQLINEERREAMCSDLEGWYNPTEIPFEKPYYWAGFCAVGQ
ncbi:CHAT domain-containing protein [Floridanema aerugineum]|uniref:CHAT domain-containing protein n=1 Tax=Floridaenema aerugineum BLCC-F46 TaxID=3153654 RepID=A0ABV4WZT4_9CYAN